jgi:hypothetical protein
MRAATLIVVVTACGSSQAEQRQASAPAGTARSASDDPCRFSTPEAMGKAFGRPLKSLRLANVCEYTTMGTGPLDRVVVQVTAGPEGTVLQHARKTVAQGIRGPEKVATGAGEAYVDSALNVFIGRAANHDVQIETTIQPLSREAMITLGTRIMQTLARK